MLDFKVCINMKSFHPEIWVEAKIYASLKSAKSMCANAPRQAILFNKLQCFLYFIDPSGTDVSICKSSMDITCRCSIMNRSLNSLDQILSTTIRNELNITYPSPPVSVYNPA